MTFGVLGVARILAIEGASFTVLAVRCSVPLAPRLSFSRMMKRRVLRVYVA